MSRIAELAALVAKQGAAVRPVPALGAGDTEVASVVLEADADVLAAAHNALPALVELARIGAKIDERVQRKLYTVLVADRKALAAALAKLNA